jgi:hypothetical protein
MEWTTFWAALTAFGTFGLIGLGWYQITAVRNENKGWRTLEACERYESDPVLDVCLRNIFAANQTGDFTANPQNYRLDATTVLNFFDGIAIGIAQDLYLEELVRDHLEPIVKWYVEVYLEPVFASRMGIDPTIEYPRLIKLNQKWKLDQSITRFRAGSGTLRRQST